MSARTELTDLIRPLLPRTWTVVPNERNLDELTQPAVRISQQSIARHPTAPNSKLLVTFLVRVIAPGTDLERVEDDLDALVALMLLVLETLSPAVAWDGAATKAMTPDEHLCYDIPVTITVTKPAAPIPL